MTRMEFAAACGERTILPAIALENDNVRKALEDHNDDAVIKALDIEF